METFGTALVTGVSGTVGSAVARRLAESGMKVHGTSRTALATSPGVAFLQADLSDRTRVIEVAAGAELVVHCAATLGNDLAECIAINVDGTHNLLDALLRAGTRRLIHISTISVYDSRRTLQFDEDSALWSEPGPGYGYSKAQAERLVIDARKQGLASVILRPAVVLSMHPNSYWGPLAVARARERGAEQPVFAGRQLPYVHVDNLCQAVLLAARDSAAVDRAYNVVDAEAPATEYASAIEAAIGRPTAAIPTTAFPSIKAERIRRELGYSPADRWPDFLRELARALPDAPT